jgi:hypothetical protein
MEYYQPNGAEVRAGSVGGVLGNLSFAESALASR